MDSTVARNSKKRHSSKFKARVALDALREQNTIAQLASRHQIHASQVSKWKRCVTEGVESLFERDGVHVDRSNEELVDKLYRQIGQLQVELDWLKKKYGEYTG